MILDAQKGFVQEPPRYDICIVGAGAAGITLALELEPTGLQVCLLEAGGSGYEAETLRLFEGELTGQPYPSLRSWGSRRSASSCSGRSGCTSS
jgi:choline dehydrogenase-like flavoprotein